MRLVVSSAGGVNGNGYNIAGVPRANMPLSGLVSSTFRPQQTLETPDSPSIVPGEIALNFATRDFFVAVRRMRSVSHAWRPEWVAV